MRFPILLFIAVTMYGQPGALESGKQLFAGACSACHGANGEGGHGPSLVDGWQVRRAADADLFNSLKKGVPGTDMPPCSLTAEKNRLLAAFLRSLTRPSIASRVKRHGLA